MLPHVSNSGWIGILSAALAKLEPLLMQSPHSDFAVRLITVDITPGAGRTFYSFRTALDNLPRVHLCSWLVVLNRESGLIISSPLILFRQVPSRPSINPEIGEADSSAKLLHSSESEIKMIWYRSLRRTQPLSLGRRTIINAGVHASPDAATTRCLVGSAIHLISGQ